MKPTPEDKGRVAKIARKCLAAKEGIPPTGPSETVILDQDKWWLCNKLREAWDEIDRLEEKHAMLMTGYNGRP